jgi:AbrB family looped-hinge helix DNA binding protein
MIHSTVTSKGQTTLPAPIRKALQLKAGDLIQYEIQGDSVILRPHPGAMAVFGALKPSAGQAGIPFQIARSKSRDLRLEKIAEEGRQ